jgi:hypothetical protein
MVVKLPLQGPSFTVIVDQILQDLSSRMTYSMTPPTTPSD